MKHDSIYYSFIGFIVAIIPYLILIILVNDNSLSNLLMKFGLITALVNSYYFYKKTKFLN